MQFEEVKDASKPASTERVMVEATGGKLTFARWVYVWGSTTHMHWIDDDALPVRNVARWFKQVSQDATT